MNTCIFVHICYWPFHLILEWITMKNDKIMKDDFNKKKSGIPDITNIFFQNNCFEDLTKFLKSL